MVKFYSTLFTRNQSALLQLGHLHINGTQKASLKRFEFFFKIKITGTMLECSEWLPVCCYAVAKLLFAH